jgi:hypothetical protein
MCGGAMAETQEPRLAEWLRKTEAVEVVGPDDDSQPDFYCVWVTNGMTGTDEEATLIARCWSDVDAELVACALRRLQGSEDG